MVVSNGAAFSFVCQIYLIQPLNPSAFVMFEFELLFTPKVYGLSRSDQHLSDSIKQQTSVSNAMYSQCRMLEVSFNKDGK